MTTETNDDTCPPHCEVMHGERGCPEWRPGSEVK